MNVRPDELQVTQGPGPRQEAYAELVHRHIRYVFAICLSLLGEPADAEDAVQEVFVKGFERLDTLRDRERFGPWIGQIARNRCLDVLRARGRSPEQPLSPNIAGRTQLQPDDHADLKAALARLPAEHREPLLLYYFDGRDTRSIARQLGLTQGGVCARLHRARLHLRSLLDEASREGGGNHD